MERNEKDITLILDRHNNELWIDTSGHRVYIRDVTGINFAGAAYGTPMWTIMSNGKKIGNVWDVKEIKEKW